MIEATIIADSVNAQGDRLTTYKLRYWRAIHAELMTHRVFSRNASSSRAVPFAKLVEEATNTGLMAMPEVWGAERKGMQIGELLNFGETKIAKELWHEAACRARDTASELVALGVHKSIINRLLEPFTHINVVVSATEWDNFFGLRLDTAAEPTMRALAVAMWEARCASEPQLLAPGEWHLPFVDAETLTDCGRGETDEEVAFKKMIKVSVARCARVSYQSFETGKRSTVEEDLRLYDKLLSAQPLHASPAEHQATPDSEVDGPFNIGQNWRNRNEWGNFTGWRQYRKMLVGENCAPLPKEFVK